MARPVEHLPGQPAHRRGLVRRAVRPPGWVAPGPKPAGPGDREDLWPDAGEDLCYLLGDFRIFQRTDGHRWSLDDLVTAWVAWRAVGVVDRSAAQPSPFIRAFDLGCGIGSVLLMTAFLWPQARCVGVEAQEMSIALARRSVAYNGVRARVELRHGDLRDPATTADGPIYDLVTGTPPYFDVRAGVVSSRPQKGPCRFEQRGGVEVYIQAAARLLAPGGHFILCTTVLADERVHRATRAVGLAVQARLDVVGRTGKKPLIYIYTLRWTPCSAVDLQVLCVRDRDNQWTPAFRRVRREMALPV